jgi:peptide deformylase
MINKEKPLLQHGKSHNMKTKIIKDQSFLRQISQPVESVKEAKTLIENLEYVLNKNSNGIGLSAIQIGIPKTIGVINDNNQKQYLINPKIIAQEEEIIYPNEGCLSLPNFFSNTKRYKHFIIDNQTIEGDEFKTERVYYFYSSDSNEIGNHGIIAIAVQHEIDHFNGKLINDFDIKASPIINTDVKIGRNEPCPCGSGKKFKKCCLGKNKVTKNN